MLDISVVLPCRNEEEALSLCISDIKDTFRKHSLKGEIIISDSSSDSSPHIAKEHGVRLIRHDQEGYGRALAIGISRAESPFIFFADADGTYDFNEIPKFLSSLRNGADMVIGDRFSGHIEPGAMPYLHHYFGSPLLKFFLRLFFGSTLNDSQSGIRAITRAAYDQLTLRTTGMEFASEMIISGIKKKLVIEEIPTSYFVRKGQSKLRSFSDGWRHLRFMLLWSPLYLFFLPGLFLLMFGLTTLVWFLISTPVIFGKTFFVHPMFISSLATIVGYQIIFFSVFAKTYTLTHFDDTPSFLSKLHGTITLERGVIIGLLLVFLGAVVFFIILTDWAYGGYGALNHIKTGIFGLTFFILGIQTIFSSFMLSILGISNR